MSNTTPTSLEDIIQAVFNAGRIAAGEVVTDVHGSWIALRPDVAIAAINALIPKKAKAAQIADENNITTDEVVDMAVRKSRNATIDEIHHNFTGQTDNEREDSRI